MRLKHIHCIILYFSLLGCGRKNTPASPGFPKNQPEIATRSFLEYYRTSILENDTLLLVEQSHKEALISCLGELQNDTTNLLPSERQGLAEAVTQAQPESWNKSYFPNATLITKNRINNIFQERGVVEGWKYFYQQYGKGYVSISPPIFLRNFTLCLISFQSNCGSLCADSKVLLYKKEAGEWKEMKQYCHWVS